MFTDRKLSRPLAIVATLALYAFMTQSFAGTAAVMVEADITAAATGATSRW